MELAGIAPQIGLCRPLGSDDLPRLRFELCPARRHRKVIFVEQVPPIVEEPGVDERGHGVDLAAPRARPDRALEEFGAILRSKPRIDRRRPTGRSELGEPDDVEKVNVDARIAIFELLRHEIVKRGRGMRADLSLDADLGVLCAEATKRFVPDRGLVGLPAYEMQRASVVGRSRPAGEKETENDPDRSNGGPSRRGATRGIRSLASIRRASSAVPCFGGDFHCAFPGTWRRTWWRSSDTPGSSSV